MHKSENKNIIKYSLDELNKYHGELNIALGLIKENPGDKKILNIYFDGLVKRFENIFIHTVKLLALALNNEGINTISPKNAVQESVHIGWIKDPDFWLISMDARNSSINGINNISMDEYINIISQFSVEVEVILNLLAEIK